jgi:dUTP pyrophosphatase
MPAFSLEDFAPWEYNDVAVYSPPTPIIKFKRLNPVAKLPIRATEGAACWDLFSLEDRWMSPTATRTVMRTGIGIELPPGYVGLLCSRSGLASLQGLFVVNSPGIIDADYRGELKVIMGLLDNNMVWPNFEPTCIPAGTRIAQLLVLALPQLQAEEVTELSITERGEGGLGSTGQ